MDKVKFEEKYLEINSNRASFFLLAVTYITFAVVLFSFNSTYHVLCESFLLLLSLINLEKANCMILMFPL